MNTPVVYGKITNGNKLVLGIHNFCEWCGKYSKQLICEHCGEDAI